PDLLSVCVRCRVRRQVRLERDTRLLEPRPEARERAAHQLPYVDRLEAQLLAPREAQKGRHLALDALELFEDEGVLLVEGGANLAHELLGEAPRRGHGVADVVRDARGELADRGELLG